MNPTFDTAYKDIERSGQCLLLHLDHNCKAGADRIGAVTGLSISGTTPATIQSAWLGDNFLLVNFDRCVLTGETATIHYLASSGNIVDYTTGDPVLDQSFALTNSSVQTSQIYCVNSNTTPPGTMGTGWVAGVFSGVEMFTDAAFSWVPLHWPNYVNAACTIPGTTKAVYVTANDEGHAGFAIADYAGGRLVPIHDISDSYGFAVTATASKIYAAASQYLTAFNPSTGATDGPLYIAADATTKFDGVAASSSVVWGLDSAHNLLYKVDATNGSLLGSYSVVGTYPHNAIGGVVDGSGRPWFFDRTGTVRCFNATDGTVVMSISVAATALAMKPDGKLAVFDNGTSQCIRLYTITGGSPVAAGTIGVSAFSGSTPGSLAAGRFCNVSGMGWDSLGRLWVFQNSFSQGVVVDLYDTDDTTRIAQSWGLTYTDNCAMNPTDESMFSGAHRMSMNWSQTPGSEQTLTHVLHNGVDYENNPATNNWRGSPARICRRIVNVAGHTLVQMHGQSSEQSVIYRLGNSAQGDKSYLMPAVWFASYNTTTDGYSLQDPASGWPPNKPTNGGGNGIQWIWTNTAGDSRFSSGEYQYDATIGAGAVFGDTFLADDGSFWQYNAGAILKYPLQGFDALGNPIYTYASVVKAIPTDSAGDYPWPPDGPVAINATGPIHYDSATDALYFLTAAGDVGAAHSFGYILHRVDNWSATRTAHSGFPVYLPSTLGWMDGDQTRVNRPVSMSVAGGYVFIGYIQQLHAFVFNASNGHYVGVWKPDHTKVNVNPYSASGILDDQTGGLNARARANGEIVLTLEDVFITKTQMLRWQPVAVSAVTLRSGGLDFMITAYPPV